MVVTTRISDGNRVPRFIGSSPNEARGRIATSLYKLTVEVAKHVLLTGIGHCPMGTNMFMGFRDPSSLAA